MLFYLVFLKDHFCTLDSVHFVWRFSFVHMLVFGAQVTVIAVIDVKCHPSREREMQTPM